jgi:serine protease Do
MHKTVLPLLAVACSLALTAPAQVKNNEKKPRKEIIIRSDDKGDKTVIEIEGDKVTVNGKEVTGADKETLIMKRSTPNGRVLILEGDSLNLREPFVLRDGKPEIRMFRNEGSWNRTESRAQLGVLLQEHEKGVEVMEVSEPSAAATAGIRMKDVITSVDGKKMTKPEEMVDYIQSKKPGDKVELSLLRDGKEMSVSATLGEMKTVSEFRTFDMPLAPEMRKSIEDIMEQGPNRVIIREPGRQRPKMGLSVEEQESGEGLKVLAVTPGSSAEKAGVKKGDILRAIGGKPLSGVDDLREALEGEERAYGLSLERDGKKLDLKVSLPKPLRKADF